MQNHLKLSVDKVKILQKISDEQLAIAEVWCCCDGDNLHNLPIKTESVVNAIPTLYNKFLVAGFEDGDFMGHEGKSQLILGFFPKENNARLEEENGKSYLVVNTIISKIYAEWAYDIFVEDNFREVSMEIIVTEKEEIDGVTWISEFVFCGITVLGLDWTAACPGAHIKVTKFDTEEISMIYEDYLSFEKEGNVIESDDEKFVSDTPDGDVDKLKLENEFAESEDFKEVGTDVANSNLREEDGQMLGKENIDFAELTYQAKRDLIGSKLNDFDKYYLCDVANDFCIIFNCKEQCHLKVSYILEDKEISLDFENAVVVVPSWEENFAEEKETENMEEGLEEKPEEEFEEKEEEKEEEFEEKEEEECEEKEENIMMSNYEKLKQDNETLSKEIETLKEFKASVEKEKKDVFVATTISEVIEKCNNIPKESIDNWESDSDNFSFEKIEDWKVSVYAKAFAYFTSKEVPEAEVKKIGLPFEEDKNKKKSLWA